MPPPLSNIVDASGEIQCSQSNKLKNTHTWIAHYKACCVCLCALWIVFMPLHIIENDNNKSSSKSSSRNAIKQVAIIQAFVISCLRVYFSNISFFYIFFVFYFLFNLFLHFLRFIFFSLTPSELPSCRFMCALVHWFVACILLGI